MDIFNKIYFILKCFLGNALTISIFLIVLFYRYTFTGYFDQECFFGDILTCNHHIIYDTPKYCVNVIVKYNVIHLPIRNKKTYNL